MKKRIAVVAIAALMAGSLTNVGAVSAAEPTEITFWHYMSEDKEGKFVNEAIEEFNNSQDEVHVTAQYLPKDTMRPMTSAIYTYMNQYGTKWNSIMAYGVLLILPCCIIFLTMQKHIVEGMTSGSVKG